MTNQNIGQELKSFLLADGASCDAGVSAQQIASFEHMHGIALPQDMSDYLTAMNGSAGSYAYGIIRFWGIDEIKPLADVIREAPQNGAVIQSDYDPTMKDAQNYFVFADYLDEIQLYAIRLSPSQDSLNDVVLLDGSAPIRVANSFSEFVDLYLSSPEQLHLSID